MLSVLKLRREPWGKEVPREEGMLLKSDSRGGVGGEQIAKPIH